MPLSRRGILQASIAAVITMLGGCLGFFDRFSENNGEYSSGTLIIRNTHRIPHKITILAIKGIEIPTGKIAYKNTLRLNPDEKVIVRNFLRGTGAYTITVTLDGTQVERFEYSPVGEIGRYLEITIPESENIEWVSKAV